MHSIIFKNIVNNLNYHISRIVLILTLHESDWSAIKECLLFILQVLKK